MDAKIVVVSELAGQGFFVAQFKTSELAIFSYYVESAGSCVLIDPTLDVKTYCEFIKSRKTTLKAVFLSHYHADYLSGHTQFKVPTVMGKTAKRPANSFEVIECEDGQLFPLGQVSFTVVHTPGHTPESSCFLLAGNDSVPACIFTGDTVFLGEVGRPDLAAGSELTTEDLAGQLYESVQKLKKYADEIRVYPGHGSGSACGKAIGAGNFCTLGQQKLGNYGFLFQNKEDFVKGVTAGIPQPPKYFFYDAALNQSGPVDFNSASLKANHALSVEEFALLAKDLPIIDTRQDIGKGLIPGAYWLPSKGAITSWLANLLPPQAEFLLFADAGKWEDIAERFFRIGYFNIRGYNNFQISEWQGPLNSPKVLGFAEYKQLAAVKQLDVRTAPEYSMGVIDNAITIPIHELPERTGEVKDVENLVISCRTGLRARLAYSILKRNGIDSAVLAENFDNFAANGVPVKPQ